MSLSLVMPANSISATSRASRQRIHTPPGSHSPVCSGRRCPVHVGVFVGPVRTSRGIGSRPGGWGGRGPAFTGGMGRVTAPSEGRRISSP